MSNPSVLGAICWEAESAWGEDIGTYATDRVAVLESVDTSGLSEEVLEPQRVVQYRNDGTPYIRGIKGGSFRTKVWLTGHGSTMVGSPSIGAHETLLGLVFGVAPALSATSSTTLTGGTAAVPTTAASGTFSAGSLCRAGTYTEARGRGQFYSIATHVTTTLTLRGALEGAPTNGDVLYPVVQMPVSESPTSTAITGTRFLLQTPNLQYECHGCFPQSVAISGLNAGEVPTADITWGVSWWEYSTATFPTTQASAAAAFNPSPIAAGSWNINTVGTTTRNARSYRGFTLEHTLGVEPLKGPGGVDQRQAIIGARRIPDTITIGWTEDADAATTTPVLPGLLTAGNMLHGEFTGSTADGSAFGFSCPRMCVTNHPTQMRDGNINRLQVKVRAHTSTTTTSNLTLAAIVYGYA